MLQPCSHWGIFKGISPFIPKDNLLSEGCKPPAFNWRGQGGRGRKREKELYMIAEFPCNEGINLIFGIALKKKTDFFSVNKQ